MNKKIVTVTLNPCIDLTITIEEFLYGGTNKVIKTKKDISGKGINTSIVLDNCGLENIAAGFSFTRDSEQLAECLKKKNIKTYLIQIPGELRTNVKVFDNSKKVMSEFNDKGTYVEEKYCEKLLELLKNLMESADILIVSGSVPPGVSQEIYRTTAEIANSYGVKVIVDASGELLTKAIKAKPFLIKPNEDELRSTFNLSAETEEEIIEAANRIIMEGVNYVCVSRGSKGAVLISKDTIYSAKSMSVEIKGIQGAGDSMIAGICYAIKHGLNESDYLRYAVAAATGSLLHEGTQLCEKAELLDLVNRVEIVEKENGGLFV